MADGEQTINPLPEAQSDFLEVLQAFLQNEDANRLALTFRGWVISGGVGATAAGLTLTPTPLVAFPGGYYITETASITFTNNVTSWVIAAKDTVGDLGPYLRVPGSHYLVAVNPTAPALPAETVRIMNIVTAGGAITTWIDQRNLYPEFIAGAEPHIRLEGTEANAEDFWFGEVAGTLQLQKNVDTSDAPTWSARIQWTPADDFKGTFRMDNITGNRVWTMPDTSDTLATLNDLINAGVMPSGTRMIFDQDACPSMWTQDASSTLTDRLIHIVVGSRAPNAGSWTISGLTSSVAGHTHETATTGHIPSTGFTSFISTGEAFFSLSGNSRDFQQVTGAIAAGAIVSNPTLNTGPGTGTVTVASDGTWRPLYRDCIICVRD